MARHILKLGDIVELPDLRELAGSGRDEPLPLLYRDETLLILNKPAGLLTQGAGSVESILPGQLGVDYARAVHRLDRDTSGALIVALDPRMRAEMIDLSRSANYRSTPGWQGGVDRGEDYFDCARSKSPRLPHRDWSHPSDQEASGSGRSSDSRRQAVWQAPAGERRFAPYTPSDASRLQARFRASRQRTPDGSDCRARR